MPSSLGALELGDVVLVPFPFTSHAASKQRPAVIVSSRAYNRERPDLMAITSQLRPTRAFGEVWLRHWQSAGLIKPSAVKPVIATHEQTMVIKSLGTLHQDDARDLADAIASILGATAKAN